MSAPRKAQLKSQSQHTPGANELAADLIADMDREESPDATPAMVVPHRLTVAETPSAFTVSGRFSLSSLLPTRWERPSLDFAPDGFAASVGPLQVELYLH